MGETLNWKELDWFTMGRAEEKNGSRWVMAKKRKPQDRLRIRIKEGQLLGHDEMGFRGERWAKNNLALGYEWECFFTFCWYYKEKIKYFFNNLGLLKWCFFWMQHRAEMETGWLGFMQNTSWACIPSMHMHVPPPPHTTFTTYLQLSCIIFWLVICLISCPWSYWNKFTYPKWQQKSKVWC